MVGKILAATRKGLFTLSKNGAAKAPWKIERFDFIAGNVSMVLHDKRSGKIHAALDHGHFGVKLHRADGPGAEWTEMRAPAYPLKPQDVDERDMWDRPIPWNTVRVWALEAGGRDQPGLLWCGTLPGGVFRSDDDGYSWQIMESLWRHPLRPFWMGGGADLPGVHTVLVDPRDSNVVRLAVSSGGVWITRDAGASWHNIGQGMWQDHVPDEQKFNPNGQDAHRMAQCQSAPNRLWIQHHNGIFRSDDGAENWGEIENVKPSSFGFAVVTHPKDGDTAWFVPGIKDEQRIPVDGQFIVTRTRDGGKTFETLTKGLPATPAYDLVFRHGMDLSESGNDLVVGSSTGGLWVSEDQGDTWVEAACRLPPVHAVRWMEA